MQEVSIACPALNTFSAIFDVRTLDPRSILVKLSKELGPSDLITIYGSLDPTATSASANLTLLGNLPGNNGTSNIALSLNGWPFLFAYRSGGTSAGGTVIASGTENGTGGSLAPPSTALPALGAFSSVLDLGPLGGDSFLAGLDANQTSGDRFMLYGTNDGTAGGTNNAAGGQALGTLQGGDGTAPGTIINVRGFKYLFVQRTGGSTAGNLLAWGTAATAAGGVVSVGVTAPIENTGTSSNPVIAISPATDVAAGSMSAADKTKIDTLDAGSVVPTVSTTALRGADGSIQAAGAGFTGAAGAPADVTGATGVNVVATTGNVAVTATAGSLSLNYGANPLLLGGAGGLELSGGGGTGGVAIAAGLGMPATSPNNVTISAASALALSAGNGALTLTRNGVTWTWPNADGTAGQALKTDGSGNLGWESVDTPTKLWNYRAVTAANSPVTAAPGDWIDCDTTLGAIVVNGPSTAGSAWGVSKLNAGSNAVNISLTGGGNINALATQTIGFQWGSYTLLGTGSGARIIAST